MRVLLAHNNFHITGGAEVFCHEVARVLENMGHETAFIATRNQKSQDSVWAKYFPPGVDYKSGNLFGRVLKFGGLVYSQSAKTSMKNIINDFRPDIVHAFAVHNGLTPSILDACREAGIPAVMSCNDYKHICPNYKLFHHGHTCEDCNGGKFYNAILNNCCKESITISVASALEAAFHAHWDIYKKNIHTFLFASEFMANKTRDFWGEGRFRSAILRNPFHSPSHPLREEYEDYVLYFGRLIGEKGTDHLIQAMKEIPHVNLKIVGEGPDETKLRSFVERSEISNVTFLGPLWGNDLNDVLSRCRAVVVPSVWHENFPYVILQAFSAGKPVIGTNRGGIPELVKDQQFGIIYEASDVQALTRAILKLWENPIKTVEMGRAAKIWCDLEFNDDVFSKTLMSRYNEVLK
jgi:glycosyltransferase involved in cell wall biosynthesis